MQLQVKYQIIIVLVVASAAFAFGRWSVKSASLSKAQVLQTKQTDDKNTHTRVTITDVKTKDGTETKTIVADRVANDVETHSTTDTQTLQKTVEGKKSNLNISILGANDFSKGSLTPTYGLSVNTEVLGPITVGAFGLMNGTVGVSVGLDF